MRAVFISLLTLLVVFSVAFVGRHVIVNYHYNNEIDSFWELSVKASTLEQKSKYLDEYVEALQAAKLEGTHNALTLETPNNSYDQNMVALKSLQTRMHEIQSMDVTSFQYQTAIQQITAQEQGEAQQLTETFKGCWFLKNHLVYWDWVNLVLYLVLITLGIVFVIGIVASFD